MWTYLLILLAGTALLVIFARRAVLFSRKKNAPKKKPDEAPKEKAVNAEKVGRKEAVEVGALFQKGEALLKAGKEEEAIKLFVQALAINPAHLETQQKLAMLYMQKQMYAAASALFRALAEQTKDPLHYSHLGLAMFQQSIFEEARDAYQKAVELDPTRPQRFASLAQVYRKLGETQNAIIALNKALDIDSKNLEFLLLLGDLQVEVGNLEIASEIAAQVAEFDPENEALKDLVRAIKTTKKE